MVKMKFKIDFPIAAFLSIKEFSKMTGIPSDTVSLHARKGHWVLDGRPAAIKLPGSRDWLIHKNAVRLPTVYARKGGRPKGAKDGYKRKKYGIGQVLTKRSTSKPRNKINIVKTP